VTVDTLPLPLDWQNIWQAMPAIRRGVLRFGIVVGLSLAVVRPVPIDDADCSIRGMDITDQYGTPITDQIGRHLSIGQKAECDLPVKGGLKIFVPLWAARF
jgi:hypothetical protein